MEGSTENALMLKDMIFRYCRVSGQCINESKSTIIFNRGVDPNTCKEVEDVL